MNNLRLSPFVFVLVLGLAACGSDDDAESKSDANAANAMTMIDAGADAEAEPQYRCPNEGEEICGGKCVDTLLSMDHCGQCDNACLVGTSTCYEGDCRCLGGREKCGGLCVDLDDDRDNCGVCGESCALSDACVEGECVLISSRQEIIGVVQYTNVGRGETQDCGVNGIKPPVGPVQQHALLNQAAQVHAEDMAANDFLKHNGSDGSTPFQRAERAGYPGSYVGENVARGYGTPETVVAGWIKSDGHCKNLMNGQYTEMGVGYAESASGEAFWVQLFGDR